MHFVVNESQVGLRLDRFLAAELGVARNKIQGWVRSGAVLRNGELSSASQRLQDGDSVQVLEETISDTEPGPLSGEPWPDSIGLLGETQDYLVLDKPAGLVVHPGAGRESGTLANFLVGRWPEIAQLGSSHRPGIVHRLDVGTTGVMMVARSLRGYAVLSEAFADRRIDKLYLAIVYGHVSETLEIDLPIGRHPNDRRRMAIRRTGRPARSTVTPLAHAGDGNLSLVAVRLHTGRTHQIRVHLKAAKYPLIGDPTYGEARWKEQVPKFRKALSGFSRPALHAYRLCFVDPATNQPSTFIAPLPQDLCVLWDAIAAGTGSASLTVIMEKMSLPAPQIGAITD